MRPLSGALALTLALVCIYRGVALDVRRARPDAANGEDGLQVLFPRPGLSLCDEDQLELVAIYNGSPLLPESYFAVRFDEHQQISIFLLTRTSIQGPL